MRQQQDAASYMAEREKEKAVGNLLMECLEEFLTGKAALVMTTGNEPDGRVIYFQRPAPMP